jgi:Amt family ammonium transporter
MTAELIAYDPEVIAANMAMTNAIVPAANMSWILIAGVIIFLMQAGFALLESGSVRFKNYQNVLLKNCLDACIGGLIWWAIGFGLAYGDVDGGFAGKQYFLGIGMEGL